MSRPYPPVQKPITYTTSQAAEQSGRPVEQLDQLREQGIGPQYIWLNGSPRYAPESLNSWLRAENGMGVPN